MTINRRVMLTIAAVVMGLCGWAEVAQAQAWVNGWWTYPYRTVVNDTIARRPYSKTDKGLALSDIQIVAPPRNHKGFGIGASRFADGSSWAYRWIAIWHCEISQVWGDRGEHCDFLQICGGGDSQDVPTTVLLQDLDIHDGNAMPLLIQDGIFDKITLRDIRVRNVTVAVQIVAINSGRIGTIIIDRCPNISIGIMGRPGSIGTVYVKNSPGVRVGDTMTARGKSGAKIIYLN